MSSNARDLSKFPNEIPYDPTASGLTATDVQAAIDEVVDEQGTMSAQDANNVNISGGNINANTLSSGVLPDETLPSGVILQVAQSSTTTRVFQSGTARVSTTLTGSITLKRASSKVFVLVFQNLQTRRNQDTSQSDLFIERNGSQIVAFEGVQFQSIGGRNSNFGGGGVTSIGFLDATPGATSTYETFMRAQFANGSVAAQEGNRVSFMLLFEVSA